MLASGTEVKAEVAPPAAPAKQPSVNN